MNPVMELLKGELPQGLKIIQLDCEDSALKRQFEKGEILVEQVLERWFAPTYHILPISILYCDCYEKYETRKRAQSFSVSPKSNYLPISKLKLHIIGASKFCKRTSHFDTFEV
jgi:hypothetical protein